MSRNSGSVSMAIPATGTSIDLSSRLTAAAVAALLGAVLLFGVGFAQAELLHNAAHDSRHAFTFPCH